MGRARMLDAYATKVVLPANVLPRHLQVGTSGQGWGPGVLHRNTNCVVSANTEFSGKVT